jgi:hypothetical protein
MKTLGLAATVLFAAGGAFMPAGALASCYPGSLPSYDEIQYVSVQQFALTGVRHPSFVFEAKYVPARENLPAHAFASLDAKRAVPFTGKFSAVDPVTTFENVVGVLRAASFFGMRMNPAAHLYIDGPEDSVTVVACGITWSLGTASEGGEVELQDAQGRAFFELEDDLRSAIFSGNWTLATPSPK